VAEKADALTLYDRCQERPPSPLDVTFTYQKDTERHIDYRRVPASSGAWRREISSRYDLTEPPSRPVSPA